MKILASFLVTLFFSLSISSQNLDIPSLSPYSEIVQDLGLTQIQLSYARPSAKGRVIFGELVPFGEIWRTGANASTKITFTEDVKIDGSNLAAGTYALYTIPGQNEWTIIIHKKTDMRSIAGGKVKEENDAFRFKVKPIKTETKIETFTIQFTDITTKTCNVQLSWENTIVNIPIEVEVDAKIEAQMAEFLKDPASIGHRVYFRAAEYYLHNGKDLNTSLEWIDKALEKSEKNFRYGLLKGKIYKAKGNLDMAITIVKAAHKWAVDAKNANYISQTEVYLKSIQK